MEDDIVALCQQFPAAPKYLTQVYLLKREGEAVVGARIGERLGVTPSSVTQTLKRLEQRGLVVRGPGRSFGLTEDGEHLAKHFIRRHYLLERLLVDQLGVAWDVADDEAERLQMVLSSTLEQHIVDRLDNPDTCPHGNPFPDSEREQYLLNAPALVDTPVGDTVRIIRVTEEGEGIDGLLRFCQEHDMRVGAVVNVVEAGERHIQVRLGPNEIDVPVEFARHLRTE